MRSGELGVLVMLSRGDVGSENGEREVARGKLLLLR